MVNTEGRDATAASILKNNNDTTVQVDTGKPQLTDVSKYFVKDILNILDDSTTKGKTKLKQVRKRMYDYLK